MRKAWFWAAPLLLVACGSYDPKIDRVGGPVPLSGALSPVARAETLPCDVGAVLRSKCQRCHQNPPKNGAPIPLLTWADTRQTYLGKPVWQWMLEVVSNGFMPYMGDPNLQPPVQPLGAAEKQTLLEWLKAGAPAGHDVQCP